VSARQPPFLRLLGSTTCQTGYACNSAEGDAAISIHRGCTVLARLFYLDDRFGSPHRQDPSANRSINEQVGAHDPTMWEKWLNLANGMHRRPTW
jgi:hypothetical protein